MDIFFNANPEFTKWLAGSGALREAFVVIDVGVLGGENPRWHGLNDIAVDAAVTYARELGQRIDVERAIDLLCGQADLRRTHAVASRDGAARASIAGQTHLSREYVLGLESERAALQDQLDRIHASTSWRITAPLRTLGNALKRSS